MSEFMDKITGFIRDKSMPIFSISIAGEGIAPECARLIPTNRCQDSYSVAKAFTVTAFGLAWDRGLIKPEDLATQVLAEYVPENIDPRWHEVTLHHALTHRLGLPNGFLDIDALDAREFGRDYLDYMLRTQLIYRPGTDYAYSDGAFYLLSRAVEQVCGEPIDNLLWRELFYPMGYSEMAWSRCPMGHPMGATGLYITDEDTVKLGELYRNGGMWQGKRIISREWTDIVFERGYELTKTAVPGVYGKGGMYGQMLCIYREKGFSAAWHGFGVENGDELIQAIADFSV